MITRGLTGSLLVLLGGLVVSPMPKNARVLSFDLLADLRGEEYGRMIGLAIVLSGVGLLATAWLSMCRRVSLAQGIERENALGLVRSATLWWTVPLMIAPPLFSRDGWSYAAQGMLTRLGVSPYDGGPAALRGPIVDAVDPRWMDTPTPYGPLPLIFGDLAAHLTTDPWVLVIMHRWVAVLGLVLLAWAVPRMARWTGVNPALAAGIVIASPLMMTNGVGGLHNDLLMVGLMAAALVVAAERSWLWAAVLGGAAAAVKLPGGLICISVALVSLPLAATLFERVRRLVLVGVISLGTVVGLGLVWGLGVGWVEALAVPGSVNTPLSAPTVVGSFLDKAIGLIGFALREDYALDLVRSIATAASLLLALWVALRWKTGDRGDALRATVVVTAGLLLLSPVFHLWYLLWLFPFVAAMRMSRLGTILLVAVSVIGGVVAPLDPTLRGAYQLIIMGSVFAAALIAVLLFTKESRKRLETVVDAELPSVS